jgi:hypothetical protein
MHNKMITTSIGAISAVGITGELICQHHPQFKRHAHTTVFSIQHQQVATPKWMQLATSIIAEQNANKSNSYH